MSALPAELKVWAEPLSILAPDLQGDVAQIVRRLDALIGPLRPKSDERGGEPNGFSGLTRRGPYDRLLLSEWAILDEVPDEFVRRAIAGEHGFFELSTRQPSGGLRVRVVFDAGPEQIGAPRLVHIAALVVLARRAALANAEFTWSVAQNPAAVWSSVDRLTVGALLAARSPRPFVFPDLREEPPAAEVWTIGPPPRPGWGKVCALELQEAIDPHSERIEAHLHRNGQRSAGLDLPLPPGPRRRRLLLDPFPPLVAPIVPKAPPPPGPTPQPAGWRGLPKEVSNPVGTAFLSGTHQFVAFFESGHALIWSLANTATRGVPRPKLMHPTRRVALGWYKQHPVQIVLSSGGVTSDFVGGNAIATGDPLPAPGQGRAVQVGLATWFTDGDGQLWYIRQGVLKTGWGKVLDLAPIQDGAVVLIQSAPGAPGIHTVLLHADGTSNGQVQLHLARVGFFRTGFNMLPSVASCVDDVWTAQTGSRALPGTVHAAGRQPLAAVERYDPTARQSHCSWLLWTPGTTEFHVEPEGRTLKVPETPLFPCASADGELVGFHTEAGGVELWRVATSAPLMLRGRAE